MDAPSKHTPGPWQSRAVILDQTFFEDVNILRADGLAVAVAVQNGDIFPSEALANAHLIAAAPDLLEALRRNRAALDLIDPGRPLQYATTMDLMRRDMDAAIAKAGARS